MSCFTKVGEYAVGPVMIRPSGVLAKGQGFAAHEHTFPHTSFVISGSIEVKLDDNLPETYTSPSAFAIPAGVRHEIIALEDNTVCWCVFPHRDGDGSILDSYVGNLEAYA